MYGRKFTDDISGTLLEWISIFGRGEYTYTFTAHLLVYDVVVKVRWKSTEVSLVQISMTG